MTDMFIDPGIATGWAVFENTRLRAKGCLKELPARQISGTTYMERCNALRRRLGVLLTLHKPTRVFIEGVDARGGARGGAALYSGGLFFLSYLIGAYGAAADETGAAVRVMLAREWKGQLDKRATEAQLRVLGYAFDPGTASHIVDAVAMGAFYYAGRWK